MAPFLNSSTLVSSVLAVGRSMTNVEVLVTGFGPFMSLYPNPSFEVLSQIPEIIIGDDSGTPDILINKYPTPVKVSYDEVSQLVPELYGAYPNVELFVHLGAFDGSSEYYLERKARKGPYLQPDVDGKSYSGGNKDVAWENAPDEIVSSVDVDSIGVSDGCGLYVCEFIYYNSLLQAQRLKEEGRNAYVVFVHVPLQNDGRDTVTQVIREIVKSQ